MAFFGFPLCGWSTRRLLFDRMGARGKQRLPGRGFSTLLASCHTLFHWRSVDVRCLEQVVLTRIAFNCVQKLGLQDPGKKVKRKKRRGPSFLCTPGRGVCVWRSSTSGLCKKHCLHEWVWKKKEGAKSLEHCSNTEQQEISK